MGFLVRPMSLPSTLPLTRHLLFVDGKKSACQAAKNGSMAYTENRENPTDGFQKGKTYRFPTGESPEGANCLKECQIEAFPPPGKKNYSIKLRRGAGHARVATTKKGVNGLYDMGANVWEWAFIGQGPQQGTMGGSWWYGARQMEADYGATKPRDMAVVYLGFRCIDEK